MAALELTRLPLHDNGDGTVSGNFTDWAHVRGLAFCELLEHLPPATLIAADPGPVRSDNFSKFAVPPACCRSPGRGDAYLDLTVSG